MKLALSFPGCHRRGGVERVMVECANTLATRGHEVHVFASTIDVGVLTPQVTSHLVDCGSGPGLLRTRRFASRCQAAMDRFGPFDAHGSFGVVCPPGGDMWVQAVHTRWLEVSRQTRGLKGRLRQLLNPFHPFIKSREARHFKNRQFRSLIALTGEVRDDLIRFFDVPKSSIHVLANGYSPVEFDWQQRPRIRAEVRARLKYDPTDKVIVFVANETERKGLIPLLEAVALLNDPKLKVLAVGRLDPNESKPTIDRLGLQARVTFTGPSATVAQYYHAAEVFALPTKYEAWGLVIVEAMGCGLPVVTSRLAGAAVCVQEGHNGQLLDNPADPNEIAAKLRWALDGGADAPEQIAESVRAWRWESIVDVYERILLPQTPVKATASTPEAVRV